nr:NUDIX domain-containing protein [uncultured Oscillibacter sp.]
MEVKFYENMDDSLLQFAVILSKAGGRWVFCKHRERDTYEVPGGHREKNESILDAAKRELYEETGAVKFSIKPICVYSVIGKNQINKSGEETYGMLYFADIKAFDHVLHSEIEKIVLLDSLPSKWTYPQIQPLLIKEFERRSQDRASFFIGC